MLYYLIVFGHFTKPHDAFGVHTKNTIHAMRRQVHDMNEHTERLRQLVRTYDRPSVKQAIRRLITDGNEDAIIELLKQPLNQECSEEALVAEAVLESDASSRKLIDATIEAFLATKALPTVDHSYWVDHLNGFSRLLWGRRLTTWINRLYTRSLRSKPLDEDDNSFFLLRDFAELSRWDDRPEDFGITPENLDWAHWDGEENEYLKERIDNSPFPSEAAHIAWNLRHAKYYQCEYSNHASWDMVSEDKVNTSLARLKELGADTTEFDGLLAILLKDQLQAIQDEMERATQRRRVRLARGLDETRAALAKLG